LRVKKREITRRRNVKRRLRGSKIELVVTAGLNGIEGEGNRSNTLINLY